MDILIGISLLIIGILTHYCGKLVEYLKLPSLIETDLSIKERIFCIIAYLPKATFQSAKAAIPI